MSLVTLAKTLLCSNLKTYRYILVLNVIGHIRPQGKEVNMLFSGCNLQGFLVVGFPSSPRSTTIITPHQRLPTNHNACNVDRPESPDVTRYVLWHVNISSMELIMYYKHRFMKPHASGSLYEYFFCEKSSILKSS